MIDRDNPTPINSYTDWNNLPAALPEGAAYMIMQSLSGANLVTKSFTAPLNLCAA